MGLMQHLLASRNGQPIVTDGLVLHLDAGNAVSYPGSGTTWNDLSGNGYVATLINGPSYSAASGGQLIFDGVNDYAEVSGSLTMTSATFQAWIRRAYMFDYAGIIFNRDSGDVTGMNVHIDGQSLAYHWNDTGYTWNSGLIIPLNTWCMATIVVSPSGVTAYINTTSASNSNTHSSTTMSTINIARDSFAERVFAGAIGTASIYNRALSPAEVAQNFTANRGRFGL